MRHGASRLGVLTRPISCACARARVSLRAQAGGRLVEAVEGDDGVAVVEGRVDAAQRVRALVAQHQRLRARMHTVLCAVLYSIFGGCTLYFGECILYSER